MGFIHLKVDKSLEETNTCFPRLNRTVANLYGSTAICTRYNVCIYWGTAEIADAREVKGDIIRERGIICCRFNARK